jgi:hypothetical protein
VVRIEPLVEVDVDFEVHVLQTSIALTVHPRVDGPLDREHPIRLAELEVNPNRFREDHPFKRLDSYLILDHHELAAPSQQPADVHLVRTIHKNPKKIRAAA